MKRRRKCTEILVSSCLIGKPCAYDGCSRHSQGVALLCEEYGCMDICPELSRGLSCPRDRHEIRKGTGIDVIEGKASVLSKNGDDHTEQFIAGAERALKICRDNGIKIAIMKSKSPSCGKYYIHDGSFLGKLIKGSGVAAALLAKNGIKIFTETEVDQAKKEIKKLQDL